MIENKSYIPITEVKLEGNDEGYTFTGYGAVFGNTDSYNDVIVEGAFTNFLDGVKSGSYDMPKLLYGHNLNSIPIGKIIGLEQDTYGLKMTAQLTKGMSTAEDVRASIKHGTIDGLSIGYKAEDYEIKEDKRYLKDILLGEISVVNYPANDKSLIDVNSIKSAINEVETIKDLEKLFKSEFNCSNEVAKTLISKSKAVLQKEQDKEKAEAASNDLKEAFTLAYLKTISK